MTTLAERANEIRNWPPQSLTAYKQSLSTSDYGATYSVYADLVLANAWKQVQLVTLAEDLCPLISGRKSSDPNTIHYVYPTRASQSTSIRELSHLFQSIHAALDHNLDKILLGIVHTDSTVVYYTLNHGMAKPTVN